MPFGEEILRANSGNDSIRKRFTGYEKDTETDLDFAEARMYQNKHGRFTAVDPLMASASPGNPQTFNRYVYTGNNPINYTDPSGLDWCRDNSGVSFVSGSCSSSQTTVNGEHTVGRGGNFNGTHLNEGTIANFNADGSIEILQKPRDAQVVQRQNENIIKAEVGIIENSVAELGSTLIPNRQFETVPIAPAASQGDDRVDALVGGVNGGLEDAQTGGEKGVGNIGRDLYNLGVLLATTKNGVPNFSLASQLQVERNGYANARQARFGIATEMIPAIAGGVGGAVSRGGSAVGSVVPQTRVAAPFSTYADITIGNSTTNISTNVTKTDFITNLQKSGFSSSKSKDGIVTILEKDSLRYTVRDSAKSIPVPTAETFSNGQLVNKIRLTP